MELGKEVIIDIVRFNNEGDGVGLHNDFVVFVRGALIDEKVHVKIVDVKKNYAVGKLIGILVPSEERKDRYSCYDGELSSINCFVLSVLYKSSVHLLRSWSVDESMASKINKSVMILVMLAGATVSSGFFSYIIWPVDASIRMADSA